jgi:ubiquinone biosynthesis protein COQ9
MLGVSGAHSYHRTMDISPADMTLDELRDELAPQIAANAVFDGWTDRALRDAADAAAVPFERAKLVFQNGGIDMIDAWISAIDREMEQRNPADSLATIKIRDRISRLIQSRLDISLPQREAVRRALAVLALPTNLLKATRIGWRTADAMWRLAGDTATDLNHYTKRVTLAGIYGATLVVWLDDDSDNQADTRAFLDRRIDDVMRFEKAKARLKPDSERHFSPARLLGRLRYPDR